MNLVRAIRDKNKPKRYPRVIDFTPKQLQIRNVVNFNLSLMKVARTTKNSF